MNDRIQLLRRKVLGPNTRVDVRSFENLFGVARADAVDVWERSFDALVAGDVNAENSWHKMMIFGCVGLALTLFVARVGADDAENILPLDDSAAFALPFY